MAGVEGVITTRDANGNLDSVTIDVKKHKRAISALQEMGLLEKSQFEIDCETAISVDEAFEQVKTHVNKSWHEWKTKQ
jgi:hypothetical protein